MRFAVETPSSLRFLVSNMITVVNAKRKKYKFPEINNIHETVNYVCSIALRKDAVNRDLN